MTSTPTPTCKPLSPQAQRRKEWKQRNREKVNAQARARSAANPERKRANRKRQAESRIGVVYPADQTKSCTKCKNEKLLSEFYKQTLGRFGVRPTCKGCTLEENDVWKQNNKARRTKTTREWRENNRERSNKTSREWRAKNPARTAAYFKKWKASNPGKAKASAARWRANNPEKAKEVRRNCFHRREARARAGDIGCLRWMIRCRVATNVRDRLRPRGLNKGGKNTFKFLPYSVDELLAHLESKFQPGMSWENFGEWHIDHIIPDAAFSYTSVDHPEFQKCWSIENLQPLWAQDNMTKSDMLPHEWEQYKSTLAV